MGDQQAPSLRAQQFEVQQRFRSELQLQQMESVGQIISQNNELLQQAIVNMDLPNIAVRCEINKQLLKCNRLYGGTDFFPEKAAAALQGAVMEIMRRPTLFGLTTADQQQLQDMQENPQDYIDVEVR